MAYRIAINGYGRIGRSLLRLLYNQQLNQELKLVAINDVISPEHIAYATNYDSSHGRFSKYAQHTEQQLQIDQDVIELLQISEPKDLPWQALNVDLILDCTGTDQTQAYMQQHLAAGAKRVLFSQPALNAVDNCIVYGYNQQQIKATDQSLSAASCTTNAVTILLDQLDQEFGIEYAAINCIHSAMNDQSLIDGGQANNGRLTRSALNAMVPIDTALSKGLDRLLPKLAGRFQCSHLRVPTQNVSAMDINLSLKQNYRLEQVQNKLIQLAKQQPQLIAISNEPLTSIDFNGDTHSCIIDGNQLQLAQGKQLKLLCWFDNEWAFAHRMLDISQYWLALNSNK